MEEEAKILEHFKVRQQKLKKGLESGHDETMAKIQGKFRQQIAQQRSMAKVKESND